MMQFSGHWVSSLTPLKQKTYACLESGLRKILSVKSGNVFPEKCASRRTWQPEPFLIEIILDDKSHENDLSA
jgi:hypothetical protein